MEVSQETTKPAESNECLPPSEPAGKKPATVRRPRVKQVSSRFMSPVVPSSLYLGDVHLTAAKPSAETPRSMPAQRRILVAEDHPLSFADQNRLETVRSSETPFPAGLQGKCALAGQRKRAVKLFKENEEHDLESSRPSENIYLGKTVNSKLPARVRSRTDTPLATPRSNFVNQNHSRTISYATNSAAAKLLKSSLSTVKINGVQDSGSCLQRNLPEPSDNENDSEESSSADNFTMSDFSESETCSISSQPGNCDSPPLPPKTTKIRTIPEVRSSMPERDLLTTVSVRLLAAEGNVASDFCRVFSSPCYRSLNSALSGCQQSFNLTKSVSVPSGLPRPNLASSICLPPPHPSQVKSVADAKKGRGGRSNPEDVYLLKLLHNRYLQWRFANAKAEAAMNNQRTASEKMLHSAVARISEMRDSVGKKQVELRRLKLTQSLSTILEAQMPYLEEWESLLEDYTSSLTGTVKGLQDASIRLAIIGNVKIDIRDLGEALNSATSTLEAIYPGVEIFQPKAERVCSKMSELAGVVSRERALIEECSHLLWKTHLLQVEENSIRVQLIHLKEPAACT
ncbi:QWRF motif-containing protein 6-like [Aristolochia californica]|uniref:QWRF motif-containing protein 6-like n=1 Tax=Aristolochia californica TaxID=171875 RepID=UPI0035DB3E38